MTKDLKKSVKDALRVHQKKQWDLAKEKYQAVLDADPDDKLARRVRKYIALADTQKKPQGTSGYKAAGFSIFSPIIMVILAKLLPKDFIIMSLVILGAGLLIGVIYAIKSLFEMGIRNRLVGLFTLFIMLAYFLITSSMNTNNYIFRAKVADGIAVASALRLIIDDYYTENQILPSTLLEAGYEENPFELPVSIKDITISTGGIITITYTGQILEGKTIIYKPVAKNNLIEWDCKGGTMSNTHRPPFCK